MIQETIEALLKDKIGVAASIIGSKEIARAVDKRRLACDLRDLQTYLQRLQTSTQELEELIELVVVPETWFFRDWEPFTFLARYVTSEWLPTQSYRTLRLLSVPCSSGEEPYSIAMTLLNAGLTPNQFCIDAVDISKKSLLRAKRAVYGRHSFRGNNLEFRQRYFTQIGDEYQLSDLVKNAVNFIHGNLLEPNFLSNQSPYNAIFCRNVLIYFESSAREQSMRNLERLLANKGLIFVGHAETTQISQSLFESVRHPLAFAYRKKDNENNELKDLDKSNSRYKPLEASQQSSSRLDLKTSGIQSQSARIFENSKTFTAKDVLGEKQGLTKYSPEITKFDKTQNSAQPSTKNILREEQSVTKSLRERTKSDKTQNSAQVSTVNMETVRRLADGGQLSEAAQLGETYLKENCTSVEAYVLLGQVYQAKGLEKQAEQCFQKAIYLEPNHYDALLHLALLKEQCGDVAKASVLRQRIQRLQKF